MFRKEFFTPCGRVGGLWSSIYIFDFDERLSSGVCSSVRFRRPSGRICGIFSSYNKSPPSRRPPSDVAQLGTHGYIGGNECVMCEVIFIRLFVGIQPILYGAFLKKKFRIRIVSNFTILVKN
jgi:hypothetical protein